MALLNIIDQISQEMDNNNFSIGIFLDLSKAFDIIDHGLLMKKLEIYGIRSNVLHWISSYLSDRSKCVSIDGVLSNPEKIICGVPQGSVLGRLFFYIVYKWHYQCMYYFETDNVWRWHKCFCIS